MQIRKVKITNFKSFREAVLRFNDSYEPNVIIGKNDSGKSNLLEALDLKFLLENLNNSGMFFDDSREQKIEFYFEIKSENFENKIKNFFDVNGLELSPIFWSKLYLKKSKVPERDQKRLSSMEKSFGKEKFLIFTIFRKNYDSGWKKEIVIGTEKVGVNLRNIFLKQLLNEVHSCFGDGTLTNLLSKKTKEEEWSLSKEEIEKIINGFVNKDKKVPLSLSQNFLKQLDIVKEQLLEISLCKSIKGTDVIFNLEEEYEINEFKQNNKLKKFFIQNLNEKDKEYILKHIFSKNAWNMDQLIIFRCEKILKQAKISFNDSKISLKPRISENKISFSIEEGEVEDWSKIKQRSLGFKFALGMMIETVDMQKNDNLKQQNLYKALNELSFDSSITDNKRSKVKNYIRDLITEVAWNLFLIDEPETHFHPDYQKQILDKMKEFCKTKDQDKKTNLLLATHSPHFICPDRYINTKVVVRNLHKNTDKHEELECSNCFNKTKIAKENINKYESKIYSTLEGFKRANLDEHESYLRTIENALGFRLKFHFPEKDKKYVLLEGITDCWLIKHIFEQKKNASNFCFYHLNANTKQHMVEYCKMLNLSFVVLFDNDDNGNNKIKKFKEESRKWREGQNKEIFLTLEEINNAKTDIESFISEKDKNKFCTKRTDDKWKIDFWTLDETVNKKNWFNDEIDEETRNNFNKIYEGILNYFKNKANKQYKDKLKEEEINKKQLKK